eukprot:TRINITY_DN11314_c0_g1_i2.p1 TRINITY_DN11314_c0_g1~~TRINITY_DN11314_c0_g1_i2.p1  ORF type:complete len:327 (+),score=45.79 TRINITY_DN11314_c0_g1_i2:1-981(+)
MRSFLRLKPIFSTSSNFLSRPTPTLKVQNVSRSISAATKRPVYQHPNMKASTSHLGEQDDITPPWLSQKLDVAKCTRMVCGTDMRDTIQRFVAESKKCEVSSFEILRKYQSDPLTPEEEKESTTEKQHTYPNQPETLLLLGPGLHKIEFEGRDIYILYHLYGEPVFNNEDSVIDRQANFVLYLEGGANNPENAKFLQHFVDSAHKWKHRSEGTFDVYLFDAEHEYWELHTKKRARELSTVILPKRLKDQVVTDMEDFLSSDSKKWYFKHQIPYKRNYLFYGPPGSGKTTLTQALATHFGHAHKTTLRTIMRSPISFLKWWNTGTNI